MLWKKEYATRVEQDAPFPRLDHLEDQIPTPPRILLGVPDWKSLADCQKWLKLIQSLDWVTGPIRILFLNWDAEQIKLGREYFAPSDQDIIVAVQAQLPEVLNLDRGFCAFQTEEGTAKLILIGPATESALDLLEEAVTTHAIG